MTTPKLRYTKPPSMTYHVDVWCDGPKCDMQRLEHDGDGWMCDICGTFWDAPEGKGMDASESWGDELDDLPLYDEEGNEINVNNQTRAEEIILGRLAADAAQELHEAGLLMPDLPAPEEVEEGKPYWYSGTYGVAVGQLAPGGRQNVMLWDSEPGGVAYDSVEGARELAYALLAAAKLAEEQE